MIFINYHLIKLELRQYHPDMEFWVDVLRRFPGKFTVATECRTYFDVCSLM